jgi:mRNA interferase MazF
MWGHPGAALEGIASRNPLYLESRSEAFMLKNEWAFHRGDIYYANLNPFFGSEQGGNRPVLVLQNDVGNYFCPTLIVAPLTSNIWKKAEQPTHYLLDGIRGLRGQSIVLLEQIKTIDKRRVDRYIGKVTREQMDGIDEALQVSLGIYIPEEIEAP